MVFVPSLALRPEPNRPYLLGHRGAPRQHPENSMEGFRTALQAGADGVEFDVRLAGDGVPVVCHDPDLKRTHREQILLRSLPHDRLPVPSLARVLETLRDEAPGALLNIELKESVAPDVLRRALDAAKWRGRTVVSSFDPTVVTAYAKARGWTVGLLVDDRRLSAPDGMALLDMTGAHFLGVRNPVFLRSLADAAHARGAGLWLWTLNRRAHIVRAVRFGADAVITDLPEKGVAALRAAAQPTLA